MEIRVGGTGIVVLMRTPGHDVELTLGLAVCEGWLSPDDPLRARPADPDSLESPDEHGNVVELELAGGLPPPRTLVSSSSCGVCGKTNLAELAMGTTDNPSWLEVDASVITALPQALKDGQSLFLHTGGAHAAGLFTREGAPICIREDVGRHNAVDKVVGWAALNRELPLSDAILCVSGRVSFEIMQKAVVAGIPVVVAVSAPSTLAVDLAERYRVTLCAFVRGEGFNVYAHSTRIRRR